MGLVVNIIGVPILHIENLGHPGLSMKNAEYLRQHARPGGGVVRPIGEGSP
jgi:hypothetical protein